MKRALLLTLIFGVMLAFVIGCGEDDENPVTPTDLETGEMTDVSFLAANEALETADGFADDLFLFMEVLISFPPIFTVPASSWKRSKAVCPFGVLKASRSTPR